MSALMKLVATACQFVLGAFVISHLITDPVITTECIKTIIMMVVLKLIKP